MPPAHQPVDQSLAECLVSTPETRQEVAALLSGPKRPSQPFWENGVGEEILVPTAGAFIRVLRFAGATNAGRPVVLVPGFGATPEGFQDFYEVVRGEAELYYLETREKPSSRIFSRSTNMSVPQSARDIQETLLSLGLANGRDFVLVALCWGAAIVLEGLLQGVIEAPTILLCDPMHALWFPKWVLRAVSPFLPVAVVRALRPLIASAMIGNMKEPAQKQRASTFVYSADVWKWKKSAEAAWDFELYGRLCGLPGEIFVLNGTADKIHDPRHYPQMAREMPGGRFIHMPTEESNRERLFGVAAREFARVSRADGLPPSLARFERQVRRRT